MGEVCNINGRRESDLQKFNHNRHTDREGFGLHWWKDVEVRRRCLNARNAAGGHSISIRRVEKSNA